MARVQKSWVNTSILRRRCASAPTTHAPFVYDVIPPHTEEGQDWRTLGHRHTVEAIIYFLKGHGHSIIDGARYDWGPGDLLSVPMFSWHRHINMVMNRCCASPPRRTAVVALGQAVYEDERYPEFWVTRKREKTRGKPSSQEAWRN